MRQILNILFIPLSWLYAVVIWIRNFLYDEHIFHSYQSAIPTICVGNLAVGGTGKTPMTEYLIRLLSPKYKVAVLSRGYGRKTRGFRVANENDTAATIGDEPMLFYQKHPNVPIAVCADRVKGMKRLQKLFPNLQCVILDDAFQHRRLQCGFSILLTPYDQLYVHDHMLPWGRLRDLPSQSLRANVIVVTKSPENVQPIDRRIVNNALQMPSYQSLYFSKIKYAPLELPGTPLIVTGIANPRPLFQHFSELYPKTEILDFSDHHVFSDADIQRILNMAKRFSCVVTTEKDYTRLMQTPILQLLGDKLYVQSMQTNLGDDQESFNRDVMLYVSENNRLVKMNTNP